MKIKKEYSSNVVDLLKEQPPFFIRYGFVFLIAFILILYIAGNFIKVPYAINLSYYSQEESTYTLVFRYTNKNFAQIQNTQLSKLYLVIENTEMKIMKIHNNQNEIKVTISRDDFQNTTLNRQSQCYLIHYETLTRYIYNFFI